MPELRIGLLGCGTVGGGFARLIMERRQSIRARYGVDLVIHRILVRQPERCRPAIPETMLTRSALEVIDADCQLVVELIGGEHTAGAFVRRSLALGRDVVTANKALLASQGGQLFAEAQRRDRLIGFEASVCGGIPIISALRHGLAGEQIESITGIVNGTCNYILTSMEEGKSFEDSLLGAQRNGFAEADPSADIDGLDAAQKISILAELAFEAQPRRISVCGIRNLSRQDVQAARRKGKVLRLIAEAVRIPAGVRLIVEPREIPEESPLAVARQEMNALLIRGRAVGELFLMGRGAGAMPTASAVLADVIGIARRRAGNA